jgi:preprotein translocase subunit SecE
MATKAALVNGDEEQSQKKPALAKRQGTNLSPNVGEKAVGAWKDFTRFLTDVRGEMRKVVTPSRKEVEATTTVVLIAVFLFGVYFWVVDNIFDLGLHQLLNKLGGLQQ